ncbi:hypothetical protein ACFOD4_13050 [Pseudoroseomonas globiformis]|uniref:Uncharacterized protein n=1 Tax=Teichococcus globiformis TaxID=2307229 RepID=A0ABV7G3I3_9PROT
MLPAESRKVAAMRVASVGSKLSSMSRKPATGADARALKSPSQSWDAVGALSRCLEHLAQTRPSVARGIIFGFGLSLLIWAAILGFILAL